MLAQARASPAAVAFFRRSRSSTNTVVSLDSAEYVYVQFVIMFIAKRLRAENISRDSKTCFKRNERL